MPIDRNCKSKKEKHQEYPDRNADGKPSPEFRIAVYLLRLLIHRQNSQCGWNVHSMASMKIRIEATTNGAYAITERNFAS